MTDETKKLIESIESFVQVRHGIHQECILKSDFDRVVEELAKPKVFDVDCAGKAMIRVVVDGDGISVTKAMNEATDKVQEIIDGI